MIITSQAAPSAGFISIPISQILSRAVLAHGHRAVVCAPGPKRFTGGATSVNSAARDYRKPIKLASLGGSVGPTGRGRWRKGQTNSRLPSELGKVANATSSRKQRR